MSAARPVYAPADPVELELFRDNVRRFFADEVEPHIEKWEKDGRVPREFYYKMGEAGLLCVDVPEEYGGSGASFEFSMIVLEEAGRMGFLALSSNLTVHSDICAPYILHLGTEEQKRHWLPKMVSGAAIGAIAMTEPGAGSDLQGIKTSALPDGEGHYLINGSKTFITNGQLADLVILACKTDARAGAKGVSLVLVETDRPGFKRGRNLKKLGQKAQDTSELFFEDLRLPASNLLGEEGRGFEYMMTELPQERLLIAITAVAMAEAALEWTLDYTRQRQAFGRPLAEFQTNRFKLAEMKTEIQIGRVFLDRCLELHLEGKLDVETAAMAKYWLTELEGRVMDQCLQMHGGYGYMLEYPIARAFADARVHRIYGGSNEIMRELVARHL